jgi:hypothetical protein
MMRIRVPAASLLGRLLVAAVAVVLSGCGPPTLDVSSPESLERSAAAIREILADDEEATFDEALFYLVGIPSLGITHGAPAIDEEDLDSLQFLDGRTADNVVAEARRRRLEEVRSAVNELEARRASSRAARRDLAAFRLSEATVFKRHRGYLEWPVMEFKIENGTNHFVAMVQIRAALLKPNHPTPWLVEELEIVFFDGLAPGESGRWRIEPEQQAWIQLIDPHPDLEFVIEPMRLEALGGRVLAATDFGAVEARRLDVFYHTLSQLRASGSLVLDQPPLPSLPPLALEQVGAATAEKGAS